MKYVTAIMGRTVNLRADGRGRAEEFDAFMRSQCNASRVSIKVEKERSEAK
jgi:hypothetical protein